jgi:hypothetical protein
VIVDCAVVMTASFKLFFELGNGLGLNLSFFTCFTIFACSADEKGNTTNSFLHFTLAIRPS